MHELLGLILKIQFLQPTERLTVFDLFDASSMTKRISHAAGFVGTLTELLYCHLLWLN